MWHVSGNGGAEDAPPWTSEGNKKEQTRSSEVCDVPCADTERPWCSGGHRSHAKLEGAGPRQKKSSRDGPAQSAFRNMFDTQLSVAGMGAEGFGFGSCHFPLCLYSHFSSSKRTFQSFFLDAWTTLLGRARRRREAQWVTCAAAGYNKNRSICMGGNPCCVRRIAVSLVATSRPRCRDAVAVCTRPCGLPEGRDTCRLSSQCHLHGAHGARNHRKHSDPEPLSHTVNNFPREPSAAVPDGPRACPADDLNRHAGECSARTRCRHAHQTSRSASRARTSILKWVTRTNRRV